jgi:hypothetical protein
MTMMETAAVPMIAGKSNADTGVFTPVTPVLNSTGMRTIRLSACLEGDGGISFRFGIRFSQDGFTWESPMVAPNAASWQTGTGWKTPTAYFNPAALSGANEYPFIQIGFFGRNASADGKVRNAMARIRVESVDVAPLSVVTPLMVVQTQGSTSTEVFIPMTGPLDATRALAARLSIELRVSSGSIKVRPGLQVSDDAETWDTAATISGYTTYLSAEGTGIGKTWTDLSAVLTKRHVRFGAFAVNTSGSDIEMGMASLRVDLRGNG